MAHCVLVRCAEEQSRGIEEWDRIYFGDGTQEISSRRMVSDKERGDVSQMLMFPCHCPSCKKANKDSTKNSSCQGVYWDSNPCQVCPDANNKGRCVEDSEQTEMNKFQIQMHESGQTEKDLTKLWERLAKVEIKGLPLKPQSDIEGMAGDQELTADQELMLEAWKGLDMQGRLAQVAVGLPTRQLFKQYLRADDTGFAIVAPEDLEESDTQSVIEAEEVWFNKHNRDREMVRIVRSRDKGEIETQSRLFYRNAYSKK